MSGTRDAPFDICVVGAGLVGAAAARHAAELRPGASRAPSVCVVGPLDNATGAARGQHFDVARIAHAWTRESPVWAALAAASIGRYAALEAASGVRFFEPCGALFRLPPPAAGTESGNGCALRGGLAGCAEPPPLLAAPPPFLSFGDADNGDKGATLRLESGARGAGTVDPSALVAAQLKTALQLGARHVSDAAVSIRRVGSRTAASDGPVLYAVATRASGIVYARRVAVAVGSTARLQQALFSPDGSTNSFDAAALPPVRCAAELAVLLEVPEAALPMLATMPCVLQYAGPPEGRYYMLPPRRYAAFGGRAFVKLGPLGDALPALPLASLRAAVAWVDEGAGAAARAAFPEESGAGARAAEAAEAAEAALTARLAANVRRSLPNVAFGECRAIRCAIDNTPSGAPVVALVDGHAGGALFAFVGGNGTAAKSSDEIGRLLARYALDGVWPADAAVPQSDMCFLPRPMVAHL